DIFCATARAVMSPSPPGPKPTTILIGRVGNSWAFAVAARPMATRQQPRAMMRAVNKFVPPSIPVFFGRASAVESVTLAGLDHSAPQRRERRRRHQLGFLLEQIAGFGILFEIRLPFRIGHHRRAPAGAIGRILVDPDMDIAVDVAGLCDQPRQRLAEMPLL